MPTLLPALLCPSGQQPAPATTHGAVSSLILGPLLLITLGLRAALAADVGGRIALNPASGTTGVLDGAQHVLAPRKEMYLNSATRLGLPGMEVESDATKVTRNGCWTATGKR